MNRVAALAALLLAAPSIASAGALPSYTVVDVVDGGGQPYKILKNTGLTLSEAREACRVEGGFLSPVQRASDRDFLVDALNRVGGNWSWVDSVGSSLSHDSLRRGEGWGFEFTNPTRPFKPTPDNHSYGAVCMMNRLW